MGGPVIRLSKTQLKQVLGLPGGAASETEATLRLTRAQVCEAVGQLGLKDKRALKERLEADLEKVDREFDRAVRTVRNAYRDVGEEEIEKDVAGAVPEVRAKYRAQSGP